jgi:hypothetical protein
MGLTMSQWDDLDDHDRAWALGVSLAEAEAEAEANAATCPSCGGLKAECQDPDNQHAYVVTTGRCYRTRALMEAQRARTGDHDGVLWKVVLDPSRKKSAVKKGASRG